MCDKVSPLNILLAISGGVDSSVAAALLKQQGHNLVGVTLKTFCYKEQQHPKACCGLEGVASARAVCSQLGIPHYVLDVTEEFKQMVLDDFVNEYAAGRTPNPCVRCNATVKIPLLLKKAKKYGCTHLATGHYAQIDPEHFSLLRGRDAAKDQSYFLWDLPKSILPNLLFPLGKYTKEQIRDKASALKLYSAKRPESQEICFVPENDYISFLKEHLPPEHPGFEPGKILDTQGKQIGQHNGYLNYTIGQRKGIGGGHSERYYVVSLDPIKKIVVAGKKDEALSNGIVIEKLNKFVENDRFNTELTVQIRHRAKPLLCTLTSLTEQEATINILEPAYAVTAGQSAVIYADNQILLGGVIKHNF